MLRRGLILAGLFLIGSGGLLWATGLPWLLAGYLAGTGLLLIVGLLIERSRYRPRLDHSRGQFAPTGERFYDPTTGQLTEVYYNAATGQRDYRPVDRPDGASVGPRTPGAGA